MNNNDALSAIHRLLSDFAWHADRSEWQALAGLFTPDGTLVLNGHRMSGSACIAEDLARRAAGSLRSTRHTWSNLRLQSLTADSADCTLTQLTFEQSVPGAATQLRISDVDDVIRCDAQGNWRFETRRISRVMSFG